MARKSEPDAPTLRDLRAIEAEWPLIAAELAVVDAEIRAAQATDVTELDRRRSRRSQAARVRSMTRGLNGTGSVGGLDGAA